jgi:hypothetical protein
MGIDAVLLLRVKSRELFRDCFERLGLPASCLDPLDDGAVLLATMEPFGADRAAATLELRTFLARAFGTALQEVHDDPRGVLAFPDACEPRARSYDGVAAEIAGAGVWLPLAPPSQAELLERMTSMLSEVDGLLELSPDAGGTAPGGTAPGGTAPGGAGAGAAGARRKDTKATAAADARELDAELQRLGHESLDAMVSSAAKRIGDDVSFACLLVQAKRAPDATRPDGVNAIHALPDGTWIVVTTRLSSATEMIALSLGEEWKPWLLEHADPRGVCVFSANHLARALASGDYEASVRAIEASGPATWVRPTTVEELIAQRSERAQRFLDG